MALQYRKREWDILRPSAHRMHLKAEGLKIRECVRIFLDVDINMVVPAAALNQLFEHLQCPSLHVAQSPLFGQ